MSHLKVKNCKFVKLKNIATSKDGIISVGEANKEIPFEIKRVFFIHNFTQKNSIRGQHAHKKLQQVLFCLNGKLEIFLDDGTNKQTIVLDDPSKGIFIGNNVWLQLNIKSDDTIILVLASEYFDENDYIRDYKQFLNFVQKN